VNSLAESLITLKLSGISIDSLIESYLLEDREIRSFYDTGILCFSTLEDIVIDTKEDERIAIMSAIVNEVTWPHDHPIHDLFDNYKGQLSELYSKFRCLVSLDDSLKFVKEVVDPIKPRCKRKKSLAQKQGARKGGRTRIRRQYV